MQFLRSVDILQMFFRAKLLQDHAALPLDWLSSNALPRRREVARRRKQELILASRNFASFAPSR
jgi:hypothetical protein